MQEKDREKEAAGQRSSTQRDKWRQRSRARDKERKRTQHVTSNNVGSYWSTMLCPFARSLKPRANGRNIVGCYMLRPFAHPVHVVAQSLKPVKLFSQQLPTFLLFCDRRSVAQQYIHTLLLPPQRGWISLHSSSNIVGPRTLITHGVQRLMGCIFPTMHCKSQTGWELLHPFAHHCQHARNNSQHCWRNNVVSCCARLLSALGIRDMISHKQNWTRISRGRVALGLSSVSIVHHVLLSHFVSRFIPEKPLVVG